jgi:hypothetical protein
LACRKGPCKFQAAWHDSDAAHQSEISPAHRSAGSVIRVNLQPQNTVTALPRRPEAYSENLRLSRVDADTDHGSLCAFELGVQTLQSSCAHSGGNMTQGIEIGDTIDGQCANWQK